MYPGSGPGVWIPTPPGFLAAQAPEVAYVRPFTLNSPSQFRAEEPPDFSSDTWVRDYNETKSLGAATGSTRTPEQTDLARFISDQPMLLWNRTWRGISVSQGLNLLNNARFFALLTTASSDSLIACSGLEDSLQLLAAGDCDPRWRYRTATRKRSLIPIG